MKLFFKALLVLLFGFSQNLFSQTIKKQVISAMGSCNKLPNGMMVSQSFMQQGVIGTGFGKNFFVQQGFQQSDESKISFLQSFAEVKTETYPNPVINIVNFKLSQVIEGDLEASVTDLGGRVVYQKIISSPGDLVTLNLSGLIPQNYVVKLVAKNYLYKGTLIKND